MNDQKISESQTRQKYNNEKFCNVTVGTDINNNECIVFHTNQGYIKSNNVVLLEDMR